MEGYRYPGVKPFSPEEQGLFFGREEDIARLYKIIKLEPLLLLYSRSGLGKSSVLNAGIIPRFEQDGNYHIVLLRFGAFRAGNKIGLTDMLLDKLRTAHSGDFFLEAIGQPAREDELWYHLKWLQTCCEKKNILIIFDQFEELFTYPEPEIFEFKKQLADTLNVVIPPKYRTVLEEKIFQTTHSIPPADLERLYQPLNIRVVMAIRSDKMSLLDQLKDFIPNILNKTYELTALGREQAEDAILNPAYKKDQRFLSAPFDFTDEALDEIIAYLTRGGKQKIETFQLQIICQYAESIAIAQKTTVITREALGNIKDVFENYYDNLISRLSTEDERQKARVFIEEKLIYEEDKTRLSIYEKQIYKEFNITRELLAALVDSHIIRAEPNTAGGFSYELSHDTLVEPILAAKAKRLEKQRIVDEYQRGLAQKAKYAEEQRIKSTKRLLFVVIFFLAVLIGVSGWTLKTNRELEKSELDLKKSEHQLNKVLDSLKTSKQKLQASYDTLDHQKQLLKVALEQKEKEKQKLDTALAGESRAIARLQLSDRAKDSLLYVLNLQTWLDTYNTAWYRLLDADEKRYALTTLYNLRKNAQASDNFRRSMKLYVKARNAETVDVVRALEFAYAAQKVNSNALTDSRLKTLLEQNQYEARVSVNDSIQDLYYSAPDKKIYYVSNGGTYSLDLADGLEADPAMLDSGNREIAHATFSNNGNFIISAAHNELKVWQKGRAHWLSVDSSISYNGRIMDVSNDGQYISLANGNQVWLFSRPEGTPKYGKKVLTYFSDINSVKFTADSKYLLYGCKNGNVILRNLRDEKEKTLPQDAAINVLACSRSGKYFLTGDEKGYIRLMDTSGRAWDSLAASSQYNQGSIRAMGFQLNDSLFYYLSDDFDNPSRSRRTTIRIVPLRPVENGGMRFAPARPTAMAHSQQARLLDDHTVLTSNFNELFIWETDPQRRREDKEIVLNDLPPLPVSERLMDSLVEFNSILNSGNRKDLLDAAKYYHTQRTSRNYFSEYSKLNSLVYRLEDKYMAQMSGTELITLYGLLAECSEQNLKTQPNTTDSSIIRSIVYRKRILELDSLHDNHLSETLNAWKAMANYYTNDPKRALIYWRALKDLFAEAIEKGHDDLENKSALTDAYAQLGDLYDNLGMADSAEAYKLKYIEAEETLQHENADNVDIARNLLYRYYDLGTLYKKLGKDSLYLRNRFKCVERSEQIAAAFPNDMYVLSFWEFSYYRVAEVYENTGDYNDALKYQLKLVAAAEDLERRYPGNKEVLDNRRDAYYCLALEYKNLGLQDNSLTYLLKSLDDIEQLRRAYPDDEDIADKWQNGYFYVGEAYERLKQYDSSLKYQEKSLDACKELSVETPSNHSYYESIGYSYYQIAEEYANKKDRANALGYMQQENDYMIAMQKRYPYEARFTKAVALSRHYLWLIYDLLEDRDSALSCLLQDVGPQAQLRSRLPNDQDVQDITSNTYYYIAQAYARRHLYAEEIRYMLEYARHREEDAKTFPNDPSELSYWTYAYSLVADAYWSAGAYDSALVYKLRYTEACVTWLKQFPNSERAALQLTISYSDVAYAYADLKDYDKALEYQDKNVNATKELIQKFPDSSAQKYNLAIALDRKGEIYRLHKDYDIALECLQKAYGVFAQARAEMANLPSGDAGVLPGLTWNYALRSEVYLFKKDLATARVYADKAFATDSTSGATQLALAAIYLVKNKLPEARDLYLAARDKISDDNITYGEWALRQLDQMEEAGLLPAGSAGVTEIRNLLKQR